MIYLDANFFILANFDLTEKGGNARKLQESIIQGRKAVTSALVLDEVIWVLIKNKKHSLLRETIQDIYSLPNTDIIEVNSMIPFSALDFIEKYNLKPRDAFHVAIMKEREIKEIASDDSDFDRVSEIKRIKF